MATWDGTIYQGEDKTLELVVTGSDDAAIDITGASLFFSVKRQYDDADADAVIAKSTAAASDLNITGAASGQAEIYLVPADTAASVLGAATYFRDLWIWQLSSSKWYNISSSTMQVRSAVYHG